jgi:hypothetical protein
MISRQRFISRFVPSGRTPNPNLSRGHFLNLYRKTSARFTSKSLMTRIGRGPMQVAPTLVTDFDWLVVEAPAGSEFVLSDVGISHFDPTPPHAHAGSAWRSSPRAQTTMAIDRRFALAVTPGYGRWGRTMIDVEDVDDLNLRSYATSEVCSFGSGQNVVCALRTLAKRNPTVVARYRPRPGRLWVTEVEGGPKRGVLDFSGHSTDGEVAARFAVDGSAFPGRR